MLFRNKDVKALISNLIDIKPQKLVNNSKLLYLHLLEFQNAKGK
jgi:hypothetical protein